MATSSKSKRTNQYSVRFDEPRQQMLEELRLYYTDVCREDGTIEDRYELTKADVLRMAFDFFTEYTQIQRAKPRDGVGESRLPRPGKRTTFIEEMSEDELKEAEDEKKRILEREHLIRDKNADDEDRIPAFADFGFDDDEYFEPPEEPEVEA